MTGQLCGVRRTFSLNSGSDDEGEPGPGQILQPRCEIRHNAARGSPWPGAAEQQEAEAAEEEPPMGDLEFCYEDPDHGAMSWDAREPRRSRR